MVTGQRVIDTLPIAIGGIAAIRSFGSGKTVVQHQLAKWAMRTSSSMLAAASAERDDRRLNEFPRLKDPKTGESLMMRTVLIANTSTCRRCPRGFDLQDYDCEYYRDMGYRVAIMATRLRAGRKPSGK